MCSACVAGEHCRGGTAAPTPCGAGVWDHDASPATACVPRTACVPGQHVADPGSATTDRTCAACATGTFSDATNAASCAPWATCASDEVEIAAGTATTDRRCFVSSVWIRQLGTSSDDFVFSVRADASGAVFVVGATRRALPGQTQVGGDDAFVRKYDAAGNELWTHQFGTSESDGAYALAVDPDGNAIVAGLTHGALPGETSAGEGDVFVRKYSSSGSLLWTRQFGGALRDAARSVHVDASGNVLVAGYTFGALPGSTSVGGHDAFVRKYDASGTELWTRQLGTVFDDQAYGVAADAAGNVVVVGQTLGTMSGPTSAGGHDAFVRMYDAAGVELWTRQLGGTASDYAYGVAVDGAGFVLVAGAAHAGLAGEVGAGLSDAFVRKYDPLGSEVWTRQFGSSSHDGATAVSLGVGGNLLVAGYTYGDLSSPNAGSADVFVRELDATGAVVSSRQLGTAALDSVQSVSSHPSGTVLLAGYTLGVLPGQTSAGLHDGFVIMLPR